jgi:hypothetical protein
MKNWINEIADSITWKKLDEKIDNGRVGTKSSIARAYMMRLSFVEYQEWYLARTIQRMQL